MTTDDIIELAKQAGFKDPTPADGYMGNAYDHRDGKDSGGSLTRFAALVRAEVLEEAAKVCDARATKNELACNDAVEDEATSLRSAAWQISVCASAIRALKGQP